MERRLSVRPTFVAMGSARTRARVSARIDGLQLIDSKLWIRAGESPGGGKEIMRWGRGWVATELDGSGVFRLLRMTSFVSTL
eukprot:6197357-Pleurochrysis_carterae.AAC.2